MSAMLGDDDFDQFDKPGAERSRRRRTGDDDFDSELEDDLLEEDYLPGKKNLSDLSDEELNDDLLQSDEEEHDQQNYSAQGVTVSLNATAGAMSSFELSKSINDESVAEEPEYEEEETEGVYEEIEEPEACTEDFAETYEENDAELTEEPVEYMDDETVDEVLELEINEPLDEFQEDDYLQSYKKQKVQLQEEQQQFVEEEAEEIEELEETDIQEPANDSEELVAEPQDFQPDTKEESDEEEDEEDEGGRIRFKTERKEGTIIRLSDATRERRNIPETLELSAEAKASLMEFEEMERQRKQGRYGSRRGGRRGGNNMMPRGMGDQRNDNRRNMRDMRQSQQQPIRSLFQQQQHIQPLLPMQRSRNPNSDMMSTSPQQEKQRAGSLLGTPEQHQQQQPKNIHINPHFKGNVTPVQVPLLPIPNQPRPSVGPQRFPGMPEFQHVPSPVPGNFNPPPRLQESWRNTPPPPHPEREPFFIGDPRFPNHHMFDQRNPPPGPPPPLLNTNHPPPNQNTLPYNQPGPGFNQPGPQPRFNQPGPPPNFNQPGPQPGFNQQGHGPQQGYNQPGPQPGFNQPRFNPPGPQPGFNQSGPQPGFNQPGFNPPGPPQPGFNQPGHQPGFNQPGPQPGFNPPGVNQSGFNPPGLNQPGFNPPVSGPQTSFNQPGPGPQPNFSQAGPGPQPGFNQPGFSRERPVRINMPSPGPMGIPPFNQNSPNIRHFGPPRQPFPPGPGQPFIPHTNMQRPMQPPMQSLHQPHHLAGPPKAPMPIQQQPFRPHSQNPQASSNRIQAQQRQGPLKQRQGVPNQMVQHQQNPHARNSNLRELPIAPSHSLDMGKRRPDSAPAAQVKPIGTTAPQARCAAARNPQEAKPMNVPYQVKEEAKVEEQYPDEDEETRKYRLKIEEQKRLREEILRRKELRRQQQAGARKKELLERLSQQLPVNTQHGHTEQEKQPIQASNNGNPIMPHTSVQARPNVKNRLQKPDSTNSPPKIHPLQHTAGANMGFQGQTKKIVKQTVQNRVVGENQFQRVQQVRPAVSTVPTGPPQTVKVVSVQAQQQEQRPAKRTVMQRSNSGGGDGQHIASKVRVIKLTGGAGDGIIASSTEGNLQMQNPQQNLQQRPPFQQRQGVVRKVTLAKGTVQQPQYFKGQPRIPRSQGEPGVPHVVNSVQAHHQPNKVIMRGRGRGVAGQMGRGRLMPNKQNLRVVECKPQPCVVSVEGLSSSTTDIQLKNLLMSVGPIQSFQMLPHQRKAVATFKEPLHALAFQQKFHRHMVDLSHINVSLVTE
ncbi:RNA-binding protein 33 [Discoglossus pictus]